MRLVIGGDGPEGDNLRKLSSDLGIKDRVKFCGNLSRQEVLKQLDLADAFVFPSHYETFGVVLIEALSRGLPVVSTRSGGPDENVSPENGFLVPTGDSDALGKAMKQLMEEYDRFDPMAIRINANQRFGPQAVGKQLMDLFKKVKTAHQGKPENPLT